MSGLLAHIRGFDRLLMGAVLLLIAIGLTSLFSLSGVRSAHFFERQMIWTAVGIIMLVASSMIDFRIFRTQTAAVISLYALAIVLLGAVLMVGPRVHGLRAWPRPGRSPAHKGK